MLPGRASLQIIALELFHMLTSVASSVGRRCDNGVDCYLSGKHVSSFCWHSGCLRVVHLRIAPYWSSRSLTASSRVYLFYYGASEELLRLGRDYLENRLKEGTPRARSSHDPCAFLPSCLHRERPIAAPAAAPLLPSPSPLPELVDE